VRGARAARAGTGGQLGLDELDQDFVPRPLARVTPARLGTWDDCPRRYRLTYLDRPAPVRAGARAAATLGAVVHLALRALFDGPVAGRTPGAAAALVDRHWSAEGFRDAGQAAVYRERARGWLADYAAELGGTDEPVGVERWVSAPAEGMVVDPVDGRGGELVVVDYKTGGRVPTVEDARASRALALYAHATARTLHRRCRRVELHHLPSGTVAAWEHDDVSLQEHLAAAGASAAAATAAAAALAEGADPAVTFPARPGERCGSCEVRRHCPEGRAAAPEARPWAGLAP